MSDTEFRSPGLGEVPVVQTARASQEDHSGKSLQALNDVLRAAYEAKDTLPVFPHDHTAACRNVLLFFIGQLEGVLSKIQNDLGVGG